MTTLLVLLAAALAAPPDGVALDLGPLDQAVQPGFDALTAADSADPRVVDRTLAGGWDGRWPDDLLRDGLSGTFTVQLKPGRWVVHTAAYPQGPGPGAMRPSAPVALEGQPVAPVPTTWAEAVDQRVTDPRTVRFETGETAWHRHLRDAHVWTRTVVDVDADGLQVDSGDHPLRALVAWPISRDDAGRAWLTEVEGARKADFHARYDPGIAPALPDPHPPAVALGRWGDEAWTAAPIDGPVALRAARGERLSVLLWFSGLEGPATLRRLPKDATAWEVLHLDDGNERHAHRPRPGVLLPARKVLSDPGPAVPRGLAIDLTIPDDARGRLRRTVVVSDGTTHRRVDLDIEVLDLQLVDVPFGVSLDLWWPFYVEDLDGIEAPSLQRWVDAALPLFRDHGIDGLTVLGGLPDPLSRDTRSTDRLDAFAERWEDVGGRDITWWEFAQLRSEVYLRDTLEPIDGAWKPAMAALANAGSSTGLTRRVFFHNEEVWDRWENLQRGQELAAMWHAAAPGVVLEAACSTPLCWGLAPDADVVRMHRYDTIFAGDVDAVRARGASPRLNNIPPRSMPLLAWATGADGIDAYQVGTQSPDPYDLVRVPDRLWYTAVDPDTGTPVPTTMLRTLAESLRVVRWIATLEAKSAGWAKTPGYKTRAAEAHAWLEGLRDSWPSGRPLPRWRYELLSGRDLEDVLETTQDLVAP